MSKKPKTTAGLMAMSDADDLPKSVKGLRGVHSGLTFFSMLSVLFDANERNPPKKKKTNEALMQIVLQDFPHNKRLQQNFIKYRGWLLNWYRHQYNKGIMTHGKIPERIAFRYDKNGHKVDSRSGLRPLSADEISAIIRKYRMFGLGMDAAIPLPREDAAHGE